MIRFYSFEEDGFVQKPEWQPHYWINVECPEKEDCQSLADLGVPDSFMENIADREERPRFEREDGWLLTIMRIPHHSAQSLLKYDTIPLGIMTKDDIIITVCHEKTEMITDFIDHANRRHINIDNQPDFVLRLIYSSTYWFLSYLQAINTTINQFFQQLSKVVSNKLLLNMTDLQKALVYFNTSLKGNSMLTDRLNKVFADDCDADLLEDVEIELGQATNTVNVYLEILSNTMDTFESIISNNLNNVMKTMTSVSLILMIPTLIASFYGMNVDVWFSSSTHAFLFIILFSLTMSFITWLVLRLKHWL